MTEPSPDVKRDIQARYDTIGARIGREVAGVRDVRQLWEVVEGTRPPLKYFRGRKVQSALALGRFQPGSTIIDVGCGTGDYTFLLARRGYRMIGVDLSPRSIEVASEKVAALGLHDVSFTVADAETLVGVPDGAADGVVSFSALRYVPGVGLALRAIRRVLRPGGCAVLDFPNRYCPWFRLLKNRFGVETHIHDHHYSVGQVVTLMREAGFDEVQARTILFTPYVLPAPLLPLFKWIDRVGEQTPVIGRMAAIIMARGGKA